MSRVLDARGVHLKRGSREILRGVDLHADAGEIVALMGLSGSGKTTMLRVIAGLEARDVGEVTAAKVGMVFQFHYLFEHLTAIDNVMLAPIQVLRLSVVEARRCPGSRGRNTTSPTPSVTGGPSGGSKRQIGRASCRERVLYTV